VVAAEAVRRLVDNAPTETAEGLRIAPGHAGAAATSMEITVVDGSEIDDQEVLEDGAHATRTRSTPSPAGIADRLP